MWSAHLPLFILSSKRLYIQHSWDADTKAIPEPKSPQNTEVNPSPRDMTKLWSEFVKDFRHTSPCFLKLFFVYLLYITTLCAGIIYIVLHKNN
jgi:hypothetical protein